MIDKKDKLGKMVIEVLSGPDILHFDDAVPTVLTPLEGNAIIKAILESQNNRDAPAEFVADRLNDLVIRVFHSYGKLTPGNERDLKAWILENARAGGERSDFVVAACDIINHFTNLDRKPVFEEFLHGTEQTNTRSIIEKHIADLGTVQDPE